MKKLTGDAEPADLSVKVPSDLKARLVRACGVFTGKADHVVSMSELTRRALEEFLTRHGVE